MKRNHLFSFFLCIILVSCTDQRKSSASIEQENPPPDIHTSQNSLDWSGTYSGIMPCASCEGIDTSLEINENHSYKLIMIYMGEDEATKIQRTGTFRWNEAGNTITLENEDKPNQYFVGENYLVKLDSDGNRITGDLSDKYILSKE